MSISVLPAAISAHTVAARSQIVHVTKQKIDNALVRFDAWFLVFVAVIIALGAVLLAGLAIWCLTRQNKRFTGRWEYRNFGLRVYFECA